MWRIFLQRILKRDFLATHHHYEDFCSFWVGGSVCLPATKRKDVIFANMPLLPLLTTPPGFEEPRIDLQDLRRKLGDKAASWLCSDALKQPVFQTKAEASWADACTLRKSESRWDDGNTWPLSSSGHGVEVRDFPVVSRQGRNMQGQAGEAAYK